MRSIAACDLTTAIIQSSCPNDPGRAAREEPRSRTSGGFSQSGMDRLTQSGETREGRG